MDGEVHLAGPPKAYLNRQLVEGTRARTRSVKFGTRSNFNVRKSAAQSWLEEPIATRRFAPAQTSMFEDPMNEASSRSQPQRKVPLRLKPIARKPPRRKGADLGTTASLFETDRLTLDSIEVRVSPTCLGGTLRKSFEQACSKHLLLKAAAIHVFPQNALVQLMQLGHGEGLWQ